MVMVQKDGSTYGRFRLLETEAHDDFYQYALANDGVSNGTGPDADDLDNDAGARLHACSPTPRSA